MYEIDSVTPNDPAFQQVLKLRYELLDEPVGAPEITEPSDNDRNSDNLHVTVVNGDRVISAARLDKLDTGEYVVRRMVTDREYQRRGLGQTVMRMIEISVRELGGERIRLNSTPDAVHFYHSLGYQDTGEVVEWQGVHHPEMVKEVE